MHPTELDHAVAEKLGLLTPGNFLYRAPEPGYSSSLSLWGNDNRRHGWHRYSPSTNWEQGGPLIEKYEITVEYHPATSEWWARVGQMVCVSGEPTPLAAAMQALIGAL